MGAPVILLGDGTSRLEGGVSSLEAGDFSWQLAWMLGWFGSQLAKENRRMTPGSAEEVTKRN